MDVDSLVEEFELSWSYGEPPDLFDFVQRLGDNDRLSVVPELVKADLHWRWAVSSDDTNTSWTTGRPDSLSSACLSQGRFVISRPRIEDYLQEFPLLYQCGDYPFDLLGEELVARFNAHERPTLAELRVRFPSVDPVRLKDAFDNALLYHRENSCDGMVSGARSLRLHDRYRILSQIGCGGMGRILLAYEKHLDRRVAIKIPLPGRHADTDTVRRLRREAIATSRIQHASIVPVYEFIEVDDECAIVSEYVEGPSLKEWLASLESPVSPRVAARIILAVADGVHAAHEEGVIHRDLKPANILLQAIGPVATGERPDDSMVVDGNSRFRVRITDFGLAHFFDTDSTLTNSGTLLGTARYMSPEQVSGRPVGPPSDVFALGVVLYELLTGTPPFAANTYAGTIEAVQHHEPVSANKHQSEVPLDLAAICERALSKEVPHRYISAGAMATDLRRFLAGDPVEARSLNSIGKLWRWSRRNRLISTLACLVCMALVWSLWQNHRLSNALVQIDAHRQETRQSHADGLVTAIRTAKTRNVSRLIENLRPHLPMAVPTLLEHYRSPGSSSEKVNTAMALVSVEPSCRDYLADELLQLPPADVSAVCAALAPCKDRLIPRYWVALKPEHGEWDWDESASVDDCKADDLQALEAKNILAIASALAAFDPQSERWRHPHVATMVATQLVSCNNPLHTVEWLDLLHPVRQHLCRVLMEIYRNERSEHSSDQVRMASSVLAHYCCDSPTILAQLVLDADASQFAMMFAACQPHHTTIVPLIRNELAVMQQHPAVINDMRAVRRRSNAAIVLLRFGEIDPVVGLLAQSADQSVRTRIIHLVDTLGVSPTIFVDHLEREDEVSVRRAVILCLGELAHRLSEQQRRQTIARLIALYELDPDSGIHGACRWTLLQRLAGLSGDGPRVRDQLAEIDRRLATGRRVGGRAWYQSTHNGHTFAVVDGPVEFLIGSSAETDSYRDPDENQRRKRIDRSFAIDTAEVSRKQFQQFMKSKPAVPREIPGTFGYPVKDMPMIAVNWYAAASYCNWLSEMEGIPRDQWCYPEEITVEMWLPDDYLSRTGYRLPTESEWEYACRANTSTIRHFGQQIDWFDRYAWNAKSAQDQPHPIRLLKPNDFGLFDIYGNVQEWCQSGTQVALPDPLKDTEEHLFISDRDIHGRVLRGGSFATDFRYTRSAYRQAFATVAGGVENGFRVARTLPTEEP